MRIEDYALIGDLETAALVGRNGSIDWMCVPRFDSPACFAALLGDEGNGRWLLRPAGETKRTSRRYREGTLVLETEFETDEGSVRIVDCMPPRDRAVTLVRLVEGLQGRVPMRMELIVRLDYGSAIPWVTKADGGLLMVQGPDALRLCTPVDTRGEDMTTVAEFSVGEGERVPFLFDWHASHEDAPEPEDPTEALDRTMKFWQEWCERCTYEGEWRDAVLESLIVLKALTHEPTGGTVAAPTTSLPEAVGGVRNWDYRYCWVRDASLSIFALMETGYVDEAIAFRDWLLRATAGDPRQIRILYGIAGERHLREEELEWLAGYEGARPVRIGNDAAEQFQLDIFGELVNAGHEGRVVAAQGGRSVDHERQQRVWRRNLALLSFLETVWTKPDQGIWEVRGPPRHFTYSKVMCWVAFDRAVKAVEEFGMDGPVDRWRRLREEIHSEVCEKAYDPERRTFTQYYGSHDLDASVLLIPSVGFLPASDERVQGTIDAIERELTEDGFVYRYSTARERGEVDGLPGEEGAFLPCSFWLAGALALSGRRNEGHARFERLLEVRNDVGLLSEEYDPRARRMVGNFPQAFTHLSLVNTARHFSEPPQQ